MTNFLRKFLGKAEWIGDVPAPAEKKATFTLKLDDLDVGTLTWTDGEWVFQYSDAFKVQDQIKPIIGFSDKWKTYRSDMLWPFFQIRVPSLEQTDVKSYLKKKNVRDVDQHKLLKHFGRRSVSNPFELVAENA